MTSHSAPTRPKTDPAQTPATPWFLQFLKRIHFYAGIFIAPFIFAAAATGALYAVAPSLEKVIYAQELTAEPTDSPLSLQQQIHAAQDYLGEDTEPSAVRPAPENGDTTRVMFADESLSKSEHRAIFVDPGTGKVTGDLTVYGTSGALPFRTTISKLHSGAFFGQAGRYYSELAASWMWVLALSGLLMLARAVAKSAKKKAELRKVLVPSKKKRYLGTLSWHRSMGVWIALFMLFFSATGITWSQLGGQHVRDLRTALNWGTPVATATLEPATGPADPHAEHHHAATAASSGTVAQYDRILRIAREEGIDAKSIEIVAPTEETGWFIRELASTLPTQADSIALNPNTLEVMDSVNFNTDYPLAAKLALWGIDFHMGIMFGIPNQIVLLVFALVLCAVVVLGYRMWFQRRPRQGGALAGQAPVRGSFRASPVWAKILIVLFAAGLCWLLPLFGISLALFVLVDVLLGMRARHRVKTERVN